MLPLDVLLQMIDLPNVTLLTSHASVHHCVAAKIVMVRFYNLQNVLKNGSGCRIRLWISYSDRERVVI